MEKTAGRFFEIPKQKENRSDFKSVKSMLPVAC